MPMLLHDIRRPAIRLQGDRDVQLLRFVARCRLIFDDEDAILTDVIHSQRRHQLLPFIENLIYYFLKFLKIYIYTRRDKRWNKNKQRREIAYFPGCTHVFLLKYIFFLWWICFHFLHTGLLLFLFIRLASGNVIIFKKTSLIDSKLILYFKNMTSTRFLELH